MKDAGPTGPSIARRGDYGWVPDLRVRHSRGFTLTRRYKTDLYGFTYRLWSLTIHCRKGCANWPTLTLSYRIKGKDCPSIILGRFK